MSCVNYVARYFSSTYSWKSCSKGVTNPSMASERIGIVQTSFLLLVEKSCEHNSKAFFDLKRLMTVPREVMWSTKLDK